MEFETFKFYSIKFEQNQNIFIYSLFTIRIHPSFSGVLIKDPNIFGCIYFPF
jgi:hypothetical protein